MNDELKPCPFCGSTDALHFDRYQSNGEWWGYIECTECIATGPVGKLKRDAVEAWNRRANNDERTEERTETHACDCVSRQGTIDAFELTTWYHQNRNGEMVKGANSKEDQAWYKAEDVYKVLKDAPSVQPDIIRCKDCKHSEHWYRDKLRCFLWHEEGIDVFEDGFCNYAERRADG